MGVPDRHERSSCSAYHAPPTPSRSRELKRGYEEGDVVVQQEPKRRKRITKSDIQHESNVSGKPMKKVAAKKDEEKRLRRFRKSPPASFLEIRDRALTQRMFALDRKRGTSDDCHPTEIVSLAGTTGNVYTIIVDKIPSCDCPYARKGNQCKHIIYVMARVLRAREDLVYQLALTSVELRGIFERAPRLPGKKGADDKDGGLGDPRRKPIDGECPICCEDFDPAAKEQIVYCKEACGNNVHAACFKQWALTKQGGKVTCPFCRTPWQADGQELQIGGVKGGEVNGEGYVNVASQLGLSGRRDYTSYNAYWVCTRMRQGLEGWEDGHCDYN